jgi:hypothetical protein
MLFRLACKILAALLLSASALASSPPMVSIDATPATLVAVSPVIFTGIVTGMRYGYHDNTKMPYTFIQFSGVKYLRRDSNVGNPSEGTLEISMAGGIRENLRLLDIDEQPEFNLGERYLIFLRGGSWRLSPIAAFEAGVLRLHGRLADDALILNYSGQPIARVDEWQFSLAKEKVANESPGFVETELDSRHASSLSSVSGSAPKDKQAEKKISEANVASAPSLKEIDNPKGRFAGYESIMRLSELQRFIDQTVQKTAGQYPEFSQVSLTPVDLLAGQGMRALPPGAAPSAESRQLPAKIQR